LLQESPTVDLNGQLRRWVVAPRASANEIAALGTGLPPLIAHLLHRRGIRSGAEADEFLMAAESLFEDPATLPDVDAATARIAAARDRGETVAVYGDFDADGVTGTALMVKALRTYGLTVVPYIPHRVNEGHGLNDGAIDALAAQGVRLIVTVDCGVTDVGPIAHASSLGIDTVITDHHLVGTDLPGASAVINPHAEHSNYGFDHLTGVGMTLKLSQALLEPQLGDRWADGLMELAAIGTITDMAPLQGENRYIVRRGLELLSRTSSAGLLALMKASRVDVVHVNAENIGFAIGPRLNAAGRLDHADVAFELLMTDDRENAEQGVAELNRLNTQRQQLTDEFLTRGREQVPAVVPPLIAVGDEGFHPGVVGLVAGRLADEFGAPTMCYSLDGDQAMASCRSAPGFHWADALDACADLLTRYGGHAQAAGFACEARVLPDLIGRLTAIAAEQLGEARPATTKTVDAEVSLPDLMGPTFQKLMQMEPFGVGNPAPLFLTRGVQVASASPLGNDGRHFKLSLRAGGALWDAIAFRQSWLAGTDYVDIVYTLSVDRWNGETRLRLGLEDYAPSQQPRLNL
jgi:single-stranded-DNA-specific exonuclease